MSNRTKLALASFLTFVLLATNASAQTDRVAVLHSSLGHCTSFSMASDGSSWITNWHCVDGAAGITIGGHPAEVLAHVPGVDLATLTGPRSSQHFVLGVAPEMGDPVYSVGFGSVPTAVHPMFGEMSATFIPHLIQLRGHVAARAMPGMSTAIPISDVYGWSVRKGHSGSPVIDRFGNVVGIASNSVGSGFAMDLTFGPTFEDFSRAVITGMLDISPPR